MIVKDPVGDFLDIFHAPYKKSGPFLAKSTPRMSAFFITSFYAFNS